LCGIAGILGPGWSADRLESSVGSMSTCLVHRGPDDSGAHLSVEDGLALAHRRLSIIDVSEAGRQPMLSASGRWVVVFNGEIYNANELRDRCAPESGFRGHCDTEVLCELIDRFGPSGAARLSVGMFAFAAWDTRERTLHLVRDRVGIKPLYMASVPGAFAFASESSALRRVPEFNGGVSRAGLAGLLRFGFVPGDLSILDNVRKVEPGTTVTVRFSGDGVSMGTERWWSMADAVTSAPEGMDETELLDLLQSTIDRSIRDRLISDRPVGAFLSGGIDSSLVVAGMSRLSPEAVRTYSIGFEQAMYDESSHARGVAAHLGAGHVEQIVSESDVLEVVPKLGAMFDEPFADSSQIPMSLVCSLARRDVVVALSGDGGDELFGGYDRYTWSVRLWSKLSGIPVPLRRAMALGLAPIPAGISAMIGRAVNRMMPARMRIGNPTDKLHRVRRILGCRDIQELYRGLLGYFHDPGDVLQGVLLDDEQPRWPEATRSDPVEGMMMSDFLEYLPNDILVKVDRTSMAVGLEARVPLLDHRVVELAWSLPMQFKIHDGIGKWPLRQLLGRQVPDRFWNRPKQGFAVPLATWLRGPLRDWGEALLSEHRLRQEGFLDPGPVRSLWDRHQRGTVDSAGALWTLLMFQTWLDEAP
jgi:asparagine synthase (glutamine-hydrolysing)